MNANIETGKRFYDHVQANHDTQYGYASVEEALAAFTALAEEQRALHKSGQTDQEDMYDFYGGYLIRCNG